MENREGSFELNVWDDGMSYGSDPIFICLSGTHSGKDELIMQIHLAVERAIRAIEEYVPVGEENEE